MAARENQFPYLVPGLADLPEHFQQVLQPVLKPGERVDSILMLPPQPFLKRGGVRRQVLLSLARGLLHVQDGQPPTVTYLPGESLLYAQHTLVLLYGRLELVGEENGKLLRMVAEYNTSGQALVDTALRQFLRLTYGANQVDDSTLEQNNLILKKLEAESFKFMNGLRLYALQPGEKLLGYVFQPRIAQPLLRFFHRPIAPASLLALSDQAVILIEENKASGASYGWVVTLCPRKTVTKIVNQPARAWRNISVHLLRNAVRAERNLILETRIAQAWETFWTLQNQPLEN